ncbi:MAG: DegT/DnrJ/EryC1/StrS family aminotransferase [Proteobacteria bacterium]|nr:DegT/DnrJ/EryC1/StrS family aminotransferase [Pseudomonadota bacterium]
MTRPFIPFALPEIGSEEIDAVTRAMRSGWVTTGPKTKEFEEKFRSFLGAEDLESIAVNSATAGLHLALEALGIGPQDQVIVPTLTFTATAEVVRYLGADPVFVDIDPDTLNIDVQGIRRAITPHTKAIMPVHYGGLACDMEAILEIAAEFDLRVIEDAAHALPCTRNGRMIGTWNSDATVFSFYANKTITTGEGGMVVTKNRHTADRMRIMRLHGMNRDAFDRFTSKKPGWHYQIVAPGYKYNLTDIAAAIGIEQLKKLPRFLARRQALADTYLRELRDLPLKLPYKPESSDTHAWHLFVIRLQPGIRLSRDQTIEELAALGIGTSVHYIPLHRHPYWRDRYSLVPERFPAAEQAYQSIISLPLYTAMTDADQQYVIESLRNLCRRA